MVAFQLSNANNQAPHPLPAALNLVRQTTPHPRLVAGTLLLLLTLLGRLGPDHPSGHATVSAIHPNHLLSWMRGIPAGGLAIACMPCDECNAAFAEIGSHAF